MELDSIDKPITYYEELFELRDLRVKLHFWNEMYKSIVDNMLVEGNLIRYELSKKNYKKNFRYVYERFHRERYQRIKRKIYFHDTGDFINDRKRALEICSHFRNLHIIEAKNSGTKYYHQVCLENKENNERFIIVGGNVVENIYGLAWEASLLSNPILKKIYSPKPVYNKAYHIQGAFRSFPNPSNADTSSICSYYPMLFADQLDITLNYTISVDNFFYLDFLSQVKEFEYKQIKK